MIFHINTSRKKNSPKNEPAKLMKHANSPKSRSSISVTVCRGLPHESRCRELVILGRPLKTGPLPLLVHLPHDTVQFFTGLLVPLQLGFLLFLLLLQELLVFGMLHYVGFLPLVVMDCGQSMEQGCHLKEWVEKNNI